MIKEAIIKLSKKEDLTYDEAESVMNEFFERVIVRAWCGMEFIASPFPVFMRENSSAVILCGIDIPSPINRKTYFTVSPA